MKIVLPGGSGHVGAALIRHFGQGQHELVVLSRGGPQVAGARVMPWDGKTLGPWAKEVDGADVVINLAGRSVNCRYNTANSRAILESRVDSTRVVGEAIARAAQPPRVWLQSSSATIYRHRLDAANDEITGELALPDARVSAKWKMSEQVVYSWEAAQEESTTPSTRKIALRAAMTMSVDSGGIFDVLATLARRGLGGRLGSGRQYVSWIHEFDFCRAVEFLIRRDDIAGAVNICSPHPLPQAEFARVLRKSLGVPIGLPAPAWMLEIGTWLMRTESELVLKSRRVVPTRLLEAGFEFEYPGWPAACAELLNRSSSPA